MNDPPDGVSILILLVGNSMEGSKGRRSLTKFGLENENEIDEIENLI